MNLVEEAISCLACAVPPGTRMAVVGSHGRGDARVDSDLDRPVVEPEVADGFAEMARLAHLLGRRLIPADVMVMSAATLVPNWFAGVADRTRVWALHRIRGLEPQP
jgi:uncharacterized protein